MITRPVSNDPRITVSCEHCGHEKPQFIIRFCGQWIDKRSTYPAAVLRAVGYNAERQGALVFNEVTS